jgi:hypothetical protein
LTYANAMATGAMFVALGGGAYALSGVPDGKGVFHGCVDSKTSVLRVVAKASSCRKAKSVKRGGRRIRIPGESAIAWNQQGPPGAAGQGAPGKDGAPGNGGAPGAPGSALAFAHVNEDGTLDTANSKNVIDVRPRCTEFAACTSPPAAKDVDYCFKLSSTPPKNAVVSTELASVKTAARVLIPGRPFSPAGGGCAPGYTAAEVFTFNTTTGDADYAGFYVVFN